MHESSLLTVHCSRSIMRKVLEPLLTVQASIRTGHGSKRSEVSKHKDLEASPKPQASIKVSTPLLVSFFRPLDHFRHVFIVSRLRSFSFPSFVVFFLHSVLVFVSLPRFKRKKHDKHVLWAVSSYLRPDAFLFQFT